MPPPPTVIGKDVAVIVNPGADKGVVAHGETEPNLNPPAPPPPNAYLHTPPPPATTK